MRLGTSVICTLAGWGLLLEDKLKILICLGSLVHTILGVCKLKLKMVRL